MPFRDKHWEELQRDCDIFPAYSDYLYGPDDRLIVTQEPGLHPLIYPDHPPQPTRYTNSMPSRIWPYKFSDRLRRPSSAGHTIQPPAHDRVAEAPSPNGGRSTNMGGIDVYVSEYPMGGGPLPLPHQAVGAFDEKENTNFQASSHSRGSGFIAAPILQSKSPGSAMVAGQRPQAKDPREHFTTATRQPPQPSYLRSSSTTDIDENPARIATFRGPIMSSPSAPLSSTSPHSGSVPAKHSEDHLARPRGYFPHSSLDTHEPNFAASPGSSFDVPMLKPDDILGDPRYLLIGPNKFQQLRAYLSEHWNVAHNAMDLNEKAKALMNIQDASNKVHNRLQLLEMETEQRKQEAQQDQVRREQGTPMLPIEQMSIHHLNQADRLHQLQNTQRSYQVYRQPQPTFSGSQTPPPNQTIYQSPDQPTQSPYYSIPQSPHPQSQQYQPQMAAIHGLPSQTPSPSPQQNHQLPQIEQAQQPQASAHLRANINRHIPKLWYCLQLVKQAPELTSEEAMADRQAAHNWLTSFKQSLPPEGHRYMVQFVNWMYRESSAGRDPLASMGRTN